MTKIAEAIVPAFLEAAIVSSPSGKQNSYAAHNLPSVVLVEARPYAQPVSYANAFAQPAMRTRESSLIEDSVRRLKEHIEKTDQVYSPPSVARWWLSLDGFEPPRGVKDAGGLANLLEKLSALVRKEAKERA